MAAGARVQPPRTDRAPAKPRRRATHHEINENQGTRNARDQEDRIDRGGRHRRRAGGRTRAVCRFAAAGDGIQPRQGGDISGHVQHRLRAARGDARRCAVPEALRRQADRDGSRDRSDPEVHLHLAQRPRLLLRPGRDQEGVPGGPRHLDGTDRVSDRGNQRCEAPGLEGQAGGRRSFRADGSRRR